MSDSSIYADGLEQQLDYSNTFYHQEPFFDVTDVPPDQDGLYDFIVTSDVLEHVAPPASKAFDNLFKVLKTGGCCILSVPYKLSGETDEHFPDLYDYRLVQRSASWVLINTTREGMSQEFTDLQFHGGLGSTLEMRLFSLDHLLALLEQSGFSKVEVRAKDNPEFGIFCKDSASVPIIATK